MDQTIWTRALNFLSDNRKSKIRNRKWSGLSLIALALLVTGGVANARQPEKVYRIGYLGQASVNKAFRERLRELGYIEGQNLVIEARFSEGKGVRVYPQLAAELVRLNVDLILTVGVGATQAAKETTSTIPIVMGNSSADPVQHGLVASLARPGGNVTGVIDIMADLAGKRLELLKQAFPKFTRVAHLSAQGSSPAVDHLKKTEIAARALGIRLQAVEVRSPDDLEKAFGAAVDAGAKAVVVVGVSFFIPNLQRIVDLELKNGLPAMHTHINWVPAGGLMSYTTNNPERYRRAAEYVDKILKGAKPSDLPVERITKFLFQINLKTAKQIGVTIPDSVLFQATKVIK